MPGPLFMLREAREGGKAQRDVEPGCSLESPKAPFMLDNGLGQSRMSAKWPCTIPGGRASPRAGVRGGWDGASLWADENLAVQHFTLPTGFVTRTASQ